VKKEMTRVKFGKRTIGILGGMGPEATADFYMRIVRIFQNDFRARYDKDYPPMLIFSAPIPDVVEMIEDETETVSYLTDAARTLESGGADFIAIPCNTVHAFLNEIRSAVKIPVLSMIESAVDRISAKQNPVGLLATRTTIRMRVYDEEFRKKRIGLVIPTEPEQAILTEVIMDLLAHSNQSTVATRLKGLVGNLKMRGAQAIVLGCTELPLVAEPDLGIEIIDPTETLARCCVTLTRASMRRSNS
jgi:aspartate racemase